jgi:hypothetical protein
MICALSPGKKGVSLCGGWKYFDKLSTPATALYSLGTPAIAEKIDTFRKRLFS